MIKYFCDLCGEEVHGTKHEDAEWSQYSVSVTSKAEGAAYKFVSCVCPGCASVIMDTISKLRVEES